MHRSAPALPRVTGRWWLNSSTCPCLDCGALGALAETLQDSVG